MPKLLLALAAAAARLLPPGLKRSFYKMGPATSALRSALNRAAPKGMTEVVIAGGLLAGRKFQLDMQAEKDYWLGTYEPELQQAIRDFVRPGMVIYDLGANVGYVSLMLASKEGYGKLFAFEPLPANQARLVTNLMLNPDVNVELVPKAVADGSGQRSFFVHASDDMGKLLGSAGREVANTKQIDIEVVSLDDFVFKDGNPKPDLVKIDVEGGEGLVVAGMVQLLAETPPMILMELHGKDAAKAAWQVLVQAGYSIYGMRSGYPLIANIDELDWKSYVIAKSGKLATI